MARRKPNIRRLRRRSKIHELIGALRYEDKIVDVAGGMIDLGVPVRCEAVAALGALGQPYLMQEDPLGEPLVIDALALAARDDEDERVREAACSALLCIMRSLAVAEGEQTDGEAETDAGKDAVAVQLARTFLLMADDALIASHEQLLLSSLGQDPHVQMNDVIVQEMLQVLDDPRPKIVERAVRLIVLHAPGRVQPVIAALRDPARAATAARALGEIKDNAAMGPLIAALRSEDPALRTACVWALGEIADSRVATALLEATSDDDYGVRHEAFVALEKLGPIGVIAMMGGLATAVSTGREVRARRWSAPDLPKSARAEKLIQRATILAIDSQRPIVQFARDLGIDPAALRERVRQAKADARKPADLLGRLEDEEIRELPAETFELPRAEEVQKSVDPKRSK